MKSIYAFVDFQTVSDVPYLQRFANLQIRWLLFVAKKIIEWFLNAYIIHQKLQTYKQLNEIYIFKSFDDMLKLYSESRKISYIHVLC